MYKQRSPHWVLGIIDAAVAIAFYPKVGHKQRQWVEFERSYNLKPHRSSGMSQATKTRLPFTPVLGWYTYCAGTHSACDLV